MERFELCPVGQVTGQPFHALEFEDAALDRVRAGLGDDVDHAAGRPSELGRRAARDDLELLHRVERDVDRRALTARLLTEEPVVVVAAVEADVIEDAALPGKRDFVAVRSLHDADARRERQEVFELAPENRNRVDRRLVQRCRGRSPRRLDHGSRGRHRHRFRHTGDLHRDRQRNGLTDSQHDVLLNVRRKPRQRERHPVVPGRELKEHEPAVRLGHERPAEVRVDVARFDGHARQACAGRVGDGSLNGAGRDLLSGCGKGKGQKDNQGTENEASRHHDFLP